MPRRRFSDRYSVPAAAPVLPDLSRQNAADARMAQFPLENETRQAQIDRANAAEAKARYDLTKQIETDRQRTAFYNGLQELEQNLNQQGFKIGTPQHAEAFAAYAHEFPLARSSADVNQTLKLHALVNDDQAALTKRMQQKVEAGRALGLEPQSASFIKGGDVDVRFTQPSQGPDIEDALAKSHQITPIQFSNLQNAQQGKIDANGNFTQSLNPGEQATAIQFQAGHDSKDASKMATHTMPLTEFNTYKQAFNQQPVPTFVAPAAVGTPAPTATPSPSVATATAAPVVDHSAALDWANANQNDPRAAVILQRAQQATTQYQDEGQ